MFEELDRGLPASDPDGVWQLITSVGAGCDAWLVDEVVRLLESYGIRRGASLLDLGAGFGNPALGLARAGYEIVAIESDPEMVSQLRNFDRGESVSVIERPWQEVLSEFAPSSFDAALILGNAIAYQDTWPARQASEGDWNPAVGATWSALSRVIRKGGLLISEISFENPCDTAHELFFRSYRHGTVNSTWLVSCNHVSKVRSIDTFVVAPSETERGRVVGYAKYIGHLFYEDEMIQALRTAGWRRLEKAAVLRDPFTTVIAVNESTGGEPWDGHVTLK
jgi:SAM-dependent methyltransferase